MNKLKVIIPIILKCMIKWKGIVKILVSQRIKLFFIFWNQRSNDLLINADLLNLRHKDLEQSHDSLQRKLAFPLPDPFTGWHPLVRVLHIGIRLFGHANTTLLRIQQISIYSRYLFIFYYKL